MQTVSRDQDRTRVGYVVALVSLRPQHPMESKHGAPTFIAKEWRRRILKGIKKPSASVVACRRRQLPAYTPESQKRPYGKAVWGDRVLKLNSQNKWKTGASNMLSLRSILTVKEGELAVRT